MNKILLITTKGCVACNIMKKNIMQAVDNTSLDIYFETKDYSLIDRKYLREHRITDYPTTMFYIDDRLVKQERGSNCLAVINRWIDVAFRCSANN